MLLLDATGPSQRPAGALEQCAFNDATMSAKHELAFLASLDDERLTAGDARGQLFAAKRTGRRHARDGRIFTVRAGSFPTEASPNLHLSVGTARDDQVVATVRTLRDDAACAAFGRRDSHLRAR